MLLVEHFNAIDLYYISLRAAVVPCFVIEREKLNIVINSWDIMDFSVIQNCWLGRCINVGLSFSIEQFIG